MLVDVRVVQEKRRLFSLARAIAKAIYSHRFELIHSQGATAGLLVSALNLFHRVPHVITLHETFDDSMIRRRFADWPWKIMSLLFARADAVHAVSHDARENLLTHLVSLRKHSSKVVVIQNGIDVDYLTESICIGRNVRSLEGLKQAEMILGFMGRYMPEKGFHVLIDAVELLVRKHHLALTRVLALGWGAFIREYQADIKRRGLSDYFVFIEHQDDVRWVLRQIDCLVIPSLREAFPLVAAEALVSGTPIIASDCIGLREALQDSPAIMFPTGKHEELADAILRAMKEPLKSRAQDYVPCAKRRFDVVNSAIQLQELFARVLKARHEVGGRTRTQ
jgi:glycosyltransferase involved in cell wall biosynthesis